jgi:hypothetical protein
MRAGKIARLGLLALLVPLVMASALAGPGVGRASAATCLSWSGLSPPSPGSVNRLNGVTAVSPCRVYAVGQYWNGFSYQTLIARWNGTGWTQQASPNPAGNSADNVLRSVAAASSGNAWAVGYYGFNSSTLIEHWDGTAWTQVTSPSPGSSNQLYSVAAGSASNAWAVGSYFNGTNWQTLAVHWNGSTWKQVPTPNPDTGHDNSLLGVTVISAGNAWAVGKYFNGTVSRNLIEHWNGSTWKVVAGPNPGGATANPALVGVAAVSASNIWAVGSDTGVTLIEHWNGSSWKRVASPTPNGLGDLQGVSAPSANSVWAVGASYNGIATQTLVEHWNGTSWQAVPSPNPAGSASDSRLPGVAATSANNVWAVGFAGSQSLAVHCC